MPVRYKKTVAGVYSLTSCFTEIVLITFIMVQVAKNMQAGAKAKPENVPAGDPANGNLVSPSSLAQGASKYGMMNRPAAIPRMLPVMAGRQFWYR